MKNIFKYPAQVLLPIKNYLKGREEKIVERKERIKGEDPFNKDDRMANNIATDAGAAKKFEHEKSVAVRGVLDKTLINIRKALTKIKIGKYGFCEECGEMIDTDRLSVDPAVSLCVKCANKKNKKSE